MTVYLVVLLSIRVDLSSSKTAMTSAYSVGIPIRACSDRAWIYTDMCHMAPFRSSQKLAVCSKYGHTIDRGMCPMCVYIHLNLLHFCLYVHTPYH